jgi:hypothetical protein
LDIFSTKDDPAAQTTPEQPVGLPGMINPNGALRDGGAAFLAALEGFSHSANDAMTDNKLKGAAFSANAYALFRNSLTNWMTAGVPFFERGELSELSAFNQSFSSFLTPSPGTNTLTFNDRGREEIFRRMAEFVTPKGNTFTVYVVGQALTELPNGTRRVDATQTRKVTFRLEPMYKSNDLDFDYNSNSSISNRFASPTNYALRVFSQTDN